MSHLRANLHYVYKSTGYSLSHLCKLIGVVNHTSLVYQFKYIDSHIVTTDPRQKKYTDFLKKYFPDTDPHLNKLERSFSPQDVAAVLKDGTLRVIKLTELERKNFGVRQIIQRGKQI